MVNKALPSASNKVVPGVATITFWPAATLAAPQTMVNVSDSPASTVVRLSVLSFTSNFSQVKTSATTNPFNPPGIFSCLSMPSTSNPVFVNNTSNSSASPFWGNLEMSIKSRNQFKEIFISNFIEKVSFYNLLKLFRG